MKAWLRHSGEWIDYGPSFAYDAEMRSAIRLALLLAIPLELANLYLATPPLDVGLDPNAGLAERLLAFQWVALHLASLPLLWRMDRAVFSGGAMETVLFAGGYFETALLIFSVTLGLRWLRQLKGTASLPSHRR